MNTFVTETESLHHLHRAGYVVAREMVEAHHADALIENVERCKSCGGYGVIVCPACNGEGCYDCSRTTEVYCLDCGGYDLLPVDAVNEAIKRVDARPENAAILGQQRELAVFSAEAARLLSGDDLARAIEAHARDLAERPRCVACLSVDVHPVDCPFHPVVLEEARANVLARTSQDVTPEGLDLYVDYLRATAASR